MRRLLTLTLLSAPALTAQSPVPSTYQDLYNTLNAQISGFNSAVSAGWNGAPYPFLNAPQLQAASSDLYTQLLGSSYYSSTVIPQLNGLEALGAKAVTVQINFPIFYQPYYTSDPSQYQLFVNFYQQLTADIRSRGLKLVVESASGMPLTGNQVASFQTYFKGLSWEDYTTGRAANALAVAQLIEPDYMTVLTEPDTEAAVSGQSTVDTPTGASQLVQQVLASLQGAGVSNVQIGAGAGSWTPNYSQFLQSLTALPLNFIDIHIYPINGNDFTNALTGADTIIASGKQVGVSECWPWKVRDSELGKLSYTLITARNPFSFWAPIDTAFLQAMVNFAQYKQAAFISPFWTQYLFNYLDYGTYGTLPGSTVLSDSYSAATIASETGTFSSTGHSWESQVIPAPDTTPPATPAAPVVNSVGPTSLTLQWTAAYDNVGVSAYNLYRNGTLAGVTTTTYYYDAGLVSGTTYTYTLSATDASGNVSAMSAPLTASTTNLTPPSVPGNLQITGVSAQSISMKWKPSSGPAGVGGYRILKGTTSSNLAVYATVTGTTFTDTGVYPSTTYYYEVKSFNPTGVLSGPSAEVQAKTKGH